MHIMLTNGTKVHFGDFEPVAPEVDAALQTLYTGFLSDQSRSFAQLRDTLLPAFEAVGLPYIRQHNDLETARRYFKGLRLPWAEYFNRSRHEEAQLWLERVIDGVILDEAANGFRIHKGAMYYFWGGTAIVQGELDKGFLLVHRSYEEGQRSGITAPTPAQKLVILSFADPHQFFGALVRGWAKHLEPFFPGYAIIRGHPYDLADFRLTFLDNNPNFETLFAFTHALARLDALAGVAGHVLDSQFAGQYELNLLFDVALLIDTAIYDKISPKPPRRPLFPALISHLSASAGFDLRDGHLTGLINPAIADPAHFDNTISALVARTFPLPFASSSIELQSDLAIAYAIRNRAAHNVLTSRSVVTQFPLLEQSLWNVLFLTADELY